MNPFFQLTLAIAVSMLVIPIVRHFAPRLGLVDLPDPRKVHAVPIPRVGGWGITAGMILPLLLAARFEPLAQSFLIGTFTLFVFGVWDDARTISHWPKFAGQLLAAGVVVLYGDLWVSHVPFLDVTLPAAVGKPFTIFALVGVINAINHSDGLDGLAGGESILSLAALAILGYISDSPLILSIALAAMGGIVGFLRYNSHPAYVFMGDCGSQVLGFTLGFLVIYLTQVANTAVSAALPLLILGVPIADILAVFYQRIRGGMNWFQATRNHVHHRLMDLGFDHYETVVIIYSLQAVLVVSGVLARYESDYTVAGIYALAIAGLFGALYLGERTRWRVGRARGAPSRLSSLVARIKASPALLKGPLRVITLLTPVLMVLSALWVAHIPSDFAATAALLALVPAAQLLWPKSLQPALLRLAIYATAMFPAYLLISHPEAVPQSLQTVITGLIVVLALAVVLYVRFGTEQRFGSTPTDYLIVCGVAALAVFGSIAVNSRQVVEAVLFAAVLMYACEIIIGRTPLLGSRRLLQFSTLATLLLISLRGAF
ncbi:MAG: undecaprenyl/decaprenyl-phosphate alpha-N-acetylglucosaminyl 1-phosphate transferase [Proteobacteria bacterium]|nr:undecaprenyl/decaprenyl-phosphate alpha-N-acetylglucosaminyl 1-phosphate transferase [Pseudomonadota bacterium]